MGSFILSAIVSTLGARLLFNTDAVEIIVYTELLYCHGILVYQLLHLYRFHLGLNALPVKLLANTKSPVSESLLQITHFTLPVKSLGEWASATVIPELNVSLTVVCAMFILLVGSYKNSYVIN